MKYLFIILPLFFSEQLFGQNKNNLILTIEENNQWLEKLNTLNHDEKIQEIKGRILSDTNSVLNECCVDGLIWTKPDNKEISECKPIIVIGSTHFHFSNKIKAATIKEFAMMLSLKNFTRIQIFNDKNKNAYDIYGIEAECGIIILYPRNQRIKRKFNDLEFY